MPHKPIESLPLESDEGWRKSCADNGEAAMATGTMSPVGRP